MRNKMLRARIYTRNSKEIRDYRPINQRQGQIAWPSLRRRYEKGDIGRDQPVQTLAVHLGMPAYAPANPQAESRGFRDTFLFLFQVRNN